MNIVREFEKRFCEEVTELLILTKESACGASVEGDMLRPSINFIASVNVKTGEFSTSKGRIEWIIKDSTDRNRWGYDFKQFTIYHIKARRNIPVKLESYMSESVNNCYRLLEVIEDNISHTKLEEMQKRISQPVIIEEDSLGKFVLDRQFSWFAGEIDWLGSKCSVSLETDEEDGDTALKAVTILKKLHKDLSDFDDRFRTYAAEKLTSLANDWLEEDAEDITKEDFAKRIEISELVITPEGDLTLYYNDDDMFWGHAVQIEANINGEISGADIVG